MKLGGVQLPNGVTISEPYAQTGIKAISQPALDGTPLRWESEWKYKSLIIAGTESMGTIILSKFEIFFMMASSSNAVYIFEDDSGVKSTVCFMNEDPPAVSAVPIHPGSADPNSVLHSLVIKLRVL